MPSKSLKQTLHDLLVEGRLEDVAELATVRGRTLGSLVALTFDPDPQLQWRAIESMGMAVEKVVVTKPAYVKEHMRRLNWLITEECGAVFWRAPECMAECAARLPAQFGPYVSIAFHLLENFEEEDLEHFRPGTIWAIGRLIEAARYDLPAVLPLVIEALDRPDSQARGMAVWCLGEVGEAGQIEGRPELLEDQGAVELYRNRSVEKTTVGRLTREVLDGAAHEVG